MDGDGGPQTLVIAAEELALLGDPADFPAAADALFYDIVGIARHNLHICPGAEANQQLLLLVQGQGLSLLHGDGNQKRCRVQGLYEGAYQAEFRRLANGHVQRHAQLGTGLDAKFTGHSGHPISHVVENVYIDHVIIAPAYGTVNFYPGKIC